MFIFLLYEDGIVKEGKGICFWFFKMCLLVWELCLLYFVYFVVYDLFVSNKLLLCLIFKKFIKMLYFRIFIFSCFCN